MGFEYGYSVARPEALVMWEAQFGDFANGAQTIIDEFLAPGEQKWGQQSGLVLLLPHGHEGQGPDHSSARIERFLQLCAQDNMTIANLTTPANYFHLLRWQALSPVRRPLVVFTPKSMLRLKASASATAEFTSGHFNPVYPDTDDPRRRRRPSRPALQRQDLLRPAQAPRGDRADRHRDRPRRAALPAADQRDLPRHRQVRPGRAPVGAGGAGQPGGLALHGARPHRGARAADPPGHASGQLGAGHRLGARPRARAARPRRARVLRRLEAAHVLHRPRDRGARQRAAARSRSASPGSPTSCRSSSTSTPTSRRPSSGSPPGWRASTTRTDSAGQRSLAGDFPVGYTESRRIASIVEAA